MARTSASAVAEPLDHVDTREHHVRGGAITVMERPAVGRGPSTRVRRGRQAPAVPRTLTAVTVDPVTIALPGTPDGVVLDMDERGNGHLYATGDRPVSLGADGMWWIVTRLIEALEDPQTVATWPRFLTLGGNLGGAASQARLQYDDRGLCLVWRRLSSGVVDDLLAWQEISHERAESWLGILRPVLATLEQQGVHRHRLLPAKTAEKWARVLER